MWNFPIFALEIPQLFEIILDRKIEEPKAEDSQISNDILVGMFGHFESAKVT